MTDRSRPLHHRRQHRLNSVLAAAGGEVAVIDLS
jgi:hypothetical protein